MLPSAEWESLGSTFPGLSFFVLPFSGQSDPTRSCEQEFDLGSGKGGSDS